MVPPSFGMPSMIHSACPYSESGNGDRTAAFTALAMAFYRFRVQRRGCKGVIALRLPWGFSALLPLSVPPVNVTMSLVIACLGLNCSHYSSAAHPDQVIFSDRSIPITTPAL